MSSSKRPTLEDVARLAKVSRATVSRVVRNVSGVNPDIVNKVNEVIAEIGFKVNPAARALAGGSTQTIGLVFREKLSDLFRNAYWGEVLQGIYMIFSDLNYQLTILVNDEDHLASVESYLFNGHVDGVLFLGVDQDDVLMQNLYERKIPMAAMGRPARNLKISFVDGDDHAGGSMAAHKLIETGCETLGLISGRDDINSSRFRVNGFKEGMAEMDFPTTNYFEISGRFTQEGAYLATNELLNEHPDIDGIFVLSDLMALGVMEALNERNIKVPEQISVISNDDSPNALATSPKLTSLGYSSRESGQSGAELLLDVIAGKPTRSITFNPYLVERGSTKNAKK